jgi:sirohydrochlorin cobaltochelatase
MDKKAILVVSSGTVNEKARRENIEAVENEIKKNFAEYEVRRAFSSEKIINKIINRYGVYIDKPEQALNKLIQENFDEVVIQPINIIPGDEYENIKNTAEKFNFKKLIIGTPLLYNYNDYDKVIEAVKFQMPKLKENAAVVLMGHGTNHSADECYSIFQSVIDKEDLNIC